MSSTQLAGSVGIFGVSNPLTRPWANAAGSTVQSRWQNRLASGAARSHPSAACSGGLAAAMTTTPDRSRTISWDDPATVLAAADGRSGLELMQSLLAGEISAPPIAATLGFTLTEVAEGRAVFQLDPGEFHYNPIGSVHGGVYATLLDHWLGCDSKTVLAGTYAHLDALKG